MYGCAPGAARGRPLEHAPTKPTEGTRTRRWWPWIVLIFVALLGGIELWARAQDPQVPHWVGPGAEEGGLQTGHPTRLWGMAEGPRANGDDITAWINSHGVRGEEPELPRPAGRQRILTLGDSSFFGFLVSDENVYTHYLERILRDKGIDVDEIIGALEEAMKQAARKEFLSLPKRLLKPALA